MKSPSQLRHARYLSIYSVLVAVDVAGWRDISTAHAVRCVTSNATGLSSHT